MLKRSKFVFYLSALIIFFAFTTQAQEVSTIEKTVVTATRTEHEVKDVPLSITAVTKDEIDRNPSGTVADLLRDIPGVELFDLSVAGAKRVMIRGESGSRVLILIDGLKISEQKSMEGAALLVDVNSIERIEVIKGPSSVLYGSEAIGGVINIITKKGGSKPVEVNLSSAFDSSSDGWNSHAAVAGAFNGLDYRVSGSYVDYDDRKTPSGDLDNSSYKIKNTSAFFGFHKNNLKMGAVYENYNADINSHTAEDTVEPPLTYFQLDLPEWSREKVALFFESENIGEKLIKARCDIYYQNTFKDFKNDMDIHVVPFGPAYIDVELEINTKNDQDTYGSLIQLDWIPLKSHYIITGIEYIRDELDSSQKTGSITTSAMPPLFRPDTAGEETLYKLEAVQDRFDLFVQDEWNFTNNWTLTAGIRNSWIKADLKDENFPDIEEMDTDDSHAVGSLGLVYTVTDNLSLRSLFAQGYRFPNMQQLFIGTSHGSDEPTFPNPDLDPETSYNYELGARFDNKAFNIDFALFYSDADDYITTKDVTGGRQYTNIDGAETYGTEIYLGYTVEGLGLTPYIQGTYLRRKYKYYDFDTYNTGHPEFMGRYGFRFETELSGGLLFWSDLYGRSADSADEISSDRDKEHTPGWTTANLSFGVEADYTCSFKISTEFNNVFDKKYTTAQSSLTAPERHFVVKVSFEF